MIAEIKEIVEAINKAANAFSTILHARQKLHRRLLQMEARIDRLCTISNIVFTKVNIYWFPEKEIIMWLQDVKDNFIQAQELAKGNSVFDLSPETDLLEEQIKITDELIEKGKELEAALEKTETKRIEKLAATVNIEKISLLKKKLENIFIRLKDKDTNSIQVYGAKGTGKTALLQHLNNNYALAGMFDIVIWCDIGNSTDTDIQLIIAKRLGLKSIGTENKNDLKSKIRKELKDARYLLLLANITNKDMKLADIGIPTDTEGSKIVYTTYFPHIRPFPPVFYMHITRLSEGDSWDLFKDIWKDGDDKIKEHQIGNIILKILRWCNGYFSLIKIVAENFKHKSSPVSWDEGLNMLRTPAMREDIYMQVMVNILHCSYHWLKDNQKLCFLFSILYREDSKIPTDCLLDCWTILNLLGPTNTGQSILEHLVIVHLLIKEGSNKQYVTVDKICRQAAMKILQEHENFKCLVGEAARKKLKGDECKDTHWISLTDSEIDDLPNEVDCSKLTTLLLQKNSKLEPVSSSFFKQMKDLLILDLSETRSESVFLKDMEKLKLLYVNGCGMTEFPVKIEHLDHELEVLDIRGCITDEIPEDIEKLKRLRRLKMSIKEGGTLDPILRKLSWLKDLIIDVKLNDEPVDGVSHMSRCYTVIGNIIKGIETLTKLTTLRFYFEDDDDIVDVIQAMGDHTLRIFVPEQGSLQHIFKDTNVNLRGRQYLQVYIGIPMTTNLKIPEYFYKYDSYVLSSDTIVIEDVIKKVLKKVKTVILVKNNSMVHLDQTAMLHIHHCLVQRCNKIETLVQTPGFSKLQTLILSDCSQLKALFFKKVVTKAMNIKYLEIRDCLAIEEIDMSLKSGADFLPALETLVLHNLQSLKKICSDLKWHSLETLEIHVCPMLTQIVPLQGDNANNLLCIKVEEMWWKKFLLGNPKINEKFKKLCQFRESV